jgi:hypothetical protein
MESDGGPKVVDLLGKAIGEPGKPSHPHPHGEVLTLYEASRNVLHNWIAAYHEFLSADHLRRAVPGFPGCVPCMVIVFNQLGEVGPIFKVVLIDT